MVQSITFAANNLTLGTGSTRVILGANSGGLTIKDISSNTLSLVPGVPVSSGSGSGGGATVYSTAADLPLSDLTAGEFALVGNSSVNTNALYVTNGGGWYKISIVNLTPSVSLSETTVTFSTANANTDIAVTINEPEGTPTTVTVSNTGIANGSVANGTFHSSNNTFIIKGGSIGVSDATFTISASDGINVGTASITLNISIVDWTQSAEDMTLWSFMGGESGHPGNRFGRIDPSGTHMVFTGEEDHDTYAYYIDNNNNVHANYVFQHSNTATDDYAGGGQVSNLSARNYHTRAIDFDATGRTLVLGSPYRNTQNGGFHIFERDVANNWWSFLHSGYHTTAKRKIGSGGFLDPYPTSGGANSSYSDGTTRTASQFGRSVALSGDSKWLVVGAPYDLDSNYGGTAYVYNRSAIGNKFSFHHELTLDISDTNGGNYTDATGNLSGGDSRTLSGFAVDISYHGDWAVIGVPSSYDDNDFPGAYIAWRNGNQANWYRHQILGPHLHGLSIDGHTKTYARSTTNHKDGSESSFGSFVCINSSSNSQVDATTIAISDPYGYYANTQVIRGTVHIYGREVSGNTWVLQDVLWNNRYKTHANGIPSGTQSYEGFGTQLDLSADGSRLFIAIPADENDGDQQGKGCMHVFDRDSSSNTWSFTSNVAFANAATGNEWASSISANEDGTRVLMTSWYPTDYAVVDAS